MTAHAWPGLDLSSWSFSELGRDAQHVSQSAPVTFTQP